MTKSSGEAKEEEQEAVIDQAGEEMKDSNSIEIKKNGLQFRSNREH